MDKRRRNIWGLILGIIIILLFNTIVWHDGAFCYDTNVAHPNIADWAVRVYEQETGEKLSDWQVACLREGAEAEDLPIRWMNHFFDPIYRVGFKSIYLTAKDWSQAGVEQKNYALGDQSWQRAIVYYQDHDEKEGLIALGHVLHLIADMSVPAHTRDDAHPEGDSYEQFVKYNWNLLYNGLKDTPINLVYYSSLNNYFDNLANYSNNNFYSDDTILLKKYNLINITNKTVEKNQYGKEFLYHYASLNKKTYRVYVSDVAFGWQDNKEKNIKLEDSYILTDYTKHLLPQAVGYSAGVIKLFFEEVEKDQDFDLDDKQISFAGKMATLLGYGAEKLIGFKEQFGSQKDVVKADEQVIKSIMSIDSTDLDNDSTEVIDNKEEVVSPKPEVIIQPVVVKEPEVVIPKLEAPVNIPVPPGFPDKDTENTENINDDTELVDVDPAEEEKVEEEKIYYGVGGGTQVNNEENSEEADDITTSTPPGDDDVTTSTPPGDDGDEDGEEGDSGGEEDTVTSTLPTITIISHEDVSYTNVSTTTISATSSEDVIKIFVNTNLAEFTSSSNWQAEVDLLEGENIFEIYGENEAGEKSITSTIKIILDTTAPEVLSLEIIQIEFTTPTIQVSWSAEDAGVGVSFYDLEYNIDGGDWINLATSTTSTVYDFVGENLLEYKFRVKAYDAFAYVSDWLESEISVADWPKTVVVNEIGWMGVSAGKSGDEWLELYNNTIEDIDLSGWKIAVSDKIINWDNIDHILPAGSYYLLERTDDDSVFEVEANGIFTLTNGLKNTGEKIILLDNASSTIDVVDCSQKWYAGTTDNGYRSMERLNPNQPGSLTSNWQTSDSVAPKGRPHGGSTMFGSPGYQNTSYWLLRGDLTVYYGDLIVDNVLTLTKVNSPYIIDSSTQIPAGLTVEVESGVIFMGANKTSFINVKGELILNGTADEPIVFTSALDTNYVQLNLTEMVGENPKAGDWSRIEVEEGGKVTADYVDFFYGGRTFTKGNNWVYGTKWISQVFRNTGGDASLNNVQFNYNYIDDTNPNYNTVIWSESPSGYDTTTTIENSILDSGYTAVNFYGSHNGQKLIGSVKNNLLKNFTNEEATIEIKYADIELLDNTFENNLSEYVNMNYFTLTNDLTLKPGPKYLFSGIEVPTDMTLTIESGVDIKLSGDVQVEGSLQANGEAGNPINFIPKGSFWGIILFTNSNSSLSYVNLTKGNGTNIFGDMNKQGVVTADNSTLSFDNVIFMDANRPYHMLYLKDSQVNLKDSIISWTNDYTGTKTVDGISLRGGEVHLDNVTFNNMKRGIQIYDSALITMENMTLGHFQNIADLNWWPASAFSF